MFAYKVKQLPKLWGTGAAVLTWPTPFPSTRAAIALHCNHSGWLLGHACNCTCACMLSVCNPNTERALQLQWRGQDGTCLAYTQTYMCGTASNDDYEDDCVCDMDEMLYHKRSFVATEQMVLLSGRAWWYWLYVHASRIGLLPQGGSLSVIYNASRLPLGSSHSLRWCWLVKRYGMTAIWARVKCDHWAWLVLVLRRW